MGETLSDKRFIELFGNKPFVDLTPEESGTVVARAKQCYIGLKPLDFDITKADKFMNESGEIPGLDYFAVLPAVLRAYTIDPTRQFFYQELYQFQTFAVELDPSCADVPRMKQMFKQLGYSHEHIEYIVLMIQKLRHIVLSKDMPWYEGNPVEKSIASALDAAIECFSLVL